MDDQDDHAIQVIGAYILSVQGLEFKQNYFSKTHKWVFICLNSWALLTRFSVFMGHINPYFAPSDRNYQESSSRM